MAGAIIINRGELANALSDAGVPYVVYRHYASERHDPISGTPADIDLGKRWWYANQHHFWGLNPGVIVQPFNEENLANDGYFYLGLMQAAGNEVGQRKLALFADSVGNPADLHEIGGRMVSETWTRRVDSGCMSYGKAHGHLACLHQYGPFNDGQVTSIPGSSADRWQWFGGRHRRVWDEIIPADSRMKIVVGECGPSDATYRGVGPFLADMRGYQERYGSDPYIGAFCFWTAGGAGPYGFEYSTIDEALPALLEELRK